MPTGAVTQAWHNDLGGATRLNISAAIWEADHRVVVRHVNPLRIISQRIESDAKRPVEAVCKNLIFRGGIRASGGTQGVGRATTQAMVTASILIFILTLIIAKIFVSQAGS